MDIKLRDISRRPLTKIMAFVLVIIFITTISIQWGYIKYANLNMESITEKDYKNSKAFGIEVNSAINNTYKLLNSKENFSTENLNYYYYLRGNTKAFKNTNTSDKRFYSDYKDSFFAIEAGSCNVGENTNASLVKSFPTNMNYTMYIAFPDSFMLEHQNEWDSRRERLIPLVLSITVCLIIALVIIIYLILVTGRRFGKEELYVTGIEKIYTELLMLGCIPLFVMFSLLHKILYYDENIGHKLSYNHIVSLRLIGITTAIIATIFLVSILSISRKIKERSHLRGSIGYIFFSKTLPYIKDLYENIFEKSRFKDYYLTGILHERQRIFIIISAVLVSLTFVSMLAPWFIIILSVLEIILIYWYVKNNNKTYEMINKGVNESFEEQMKSERMKINLITNVSHDLKTPLTSIISYIDLLSKEELSISGKDYVKILIEKSDRLKNILEDLFDLAKTTSGDTKLEIETLDLKKLVEQTLADMEDDIKKSGLKIKTIFPEDVVNIISDGNKLYRVLQNIIDNALKYSLEETRIFIELEEDDENAIISIKNISGYEIDFTASEILQRFNRGDKYRTTEGSGLGLSIAESFTKVCGGDFKIEIDGDMFKAIISFKTLQLMEE